MTISRSIVLAVTAAVVLAGAYPARAQEVRCLALIDDAAVKKATGQPMELADSVKRGPGHWECAWMARGAGGLKTAHLTFLEPEALAGMAPGQIFETNVKGFEEVSGSKRELLPGIGQQAALVKNAEQTVLYLETAAGFMTVVTNGLTKPQIAALAKVLGQAPALPAATAAAADEAPPAGPAILAHPIGALALEYARALHAGKSAEVLALTSRGARAKRQALPASERKESDAYIKKNVPPAAALEAGIRAGGRLLIAGPKATLNVSSSETRKNPDGSITASASTFAMPFELEDGQWKVAQ